jgi:bifunctional non-homologous end joining protein LigD
VNEEIKKIGDEFVEISNIKKIFYPKTGITKGDVIKYYERIAPYFIQYSAEHLIVMHRFPDGIQKDSFYQKQVPDYFPDWITTKEITLKTGEKQTLVVIDKEENLVYLANQGVLVFHSWLSSMPNIDNPDKIVFDLDPSPKTSLTELRYAVRKIKKNLEEHGLVPYLMTTGSKGYHVVAPILPEHPFAEVHDFAKHIATELANQHPDKFTTAMSKVKRKGRIFIDYLRNSFGQTSVACYSLRAKPGAPIATPLDWSELSQTAPQKYNINNIFKRLAKKKDPWKSFEKDAKHLNLNS